LARNKVTVKLGEVETALFDGLNRSEIRRAARDFIDDIENMWHTVWNASGPHPYESGVYESHIKKRDLTLRQKLFTKSSFRKGIPIGSVYNDADHSHLVEYGTDADGPGSKSPWGPDTPTPAFKIAERTAEIMGRAKIS
jgi:hypothetical protein